MTQQEVLNQAKPKVSVVVPSYNHAHFLTVALESVASQTFQDYELLIVDDASDDNSVECIKKFLQDHPDMLSSLTSHSVNQGGVATLNELILQGQGDYIALINTDDIWLPQKLELQVAFLDQHPEVGAVFSQAIFIDDQGKQLNMIANIPGNLFVQKNRSRGQWLRRLFFGMNCLCHPSVLIRRSLIDQIGLYDERFRQLPDMHMWVRVLKKAEIFIIEQPLVKFRYHAASTSRLTIETTQRNLNEVSLLFLDFFDNVPDDVFVDGFGGDFRIKGARSRDELACEKAFLYFLHDTSVQSLFSHVGIQHVFKLLGTVEGKRTLQEQYHFGYADFYRMCGKHFFDEFLIIFAHKGRIGPFNAVEDQKDLKAGRLEYSWSYFWAFNLDFFAKRIKRFPILYRLLLKMWRFLKGVFR